MADQVKTGYVHKCGKSVKSWKRRWFVLKQNGYLYYYTDSSGNIEKGKIDVVDAARVAPYTEKTKGAEQPPPSLSPDNAFVIVTKERVFTCVCEAPGERQSWISALEKIRGTSDQHYPAPTYNTQATGSSDTKPPLPPPYTPHAPPPQTQATPPYTPQAPPPQAQATPTYNQGAFQQQYQPPPHAPHPAPQPQPRNPHYPPQPGAPGYPGAYPQRNYQHPPPPAGFAPPAQGYPPQPQPPAPRPMPQPGYHPMPQPPPAPYSHQQYSPKPGYYPPPPSQQHYRPSPPPQHHYRPPPPPQPYYRPPQQQIRQRSTTTVTVVSVPPPLQRNIIIRR